MLWHCKIYSDINRAQSVADYDVPPVGCIKVDEYPNLSSNRFVK